MFNKPLETILMDTIENIQKKQPGDCLRRDLAASQAYAMYEHLKLCSENMSLVSDLSEETYVLRHFLDSLAFLQEYVVPSESKIADIGSGAGFPGVPIGILRKDLAIISIESTGKKAEYQDSLLKLLNIRNISVINERIETVGRSEFRETMDYVTSRALDSLPVLYEYALPLLKVGGKTLFFKGDDIDEELQQGEAALRELGAELETVIRYRVSDDQPYRKIIIVKKVRPTSEKYPRRTGVPRKRPLA